MFWVKSFICAVECWINNSLPKTIIVVLNWVSHTSGASFLKSSFHLRLLFSDKTFQKIFRKLAAGARLSCLFIFFFDSRIRPLKHYWGQPQCSMWALWCCPIRPGLLSALSYILDAVNAADASACHNTATQVMSPILCMLFDIDWSCTWCTKAKRRLVLSRDAIKFKTLHFIDFCIS